MAPKNTAALLPAQWTVDQVERLSRDANPEQLVRIMGELGSSPTHHGWTTDFLLRLARHDDPIVRGAALRAVGRLSRDFSDVPRVAATAAIEQALDSTNVSLRNDAIAAATDISQYLSWRILPRGPSRGGVDINFDIYMASPTRWAHLFKLVELPAMPRVGEFVKFTNHEVGDYFGWKVTAVCYRECGAINVMTELLDDVDGRGYSFEDEAELDEYVESYQRHGWCLPRALSRNRRAQNKQTE